MVPSARYIISTTQAQTSVVPNQKSAPRIMAGNCRLSDYIGVASEEVATGELRPIA